jgi:hypothetical protein
MTRWWPLLALAACGRIGFGELPPGTGTGSAGDAGGDGLSSGGDAGDQTTTVGDTGGSAIAGATRDASITVIGGSQTWNYGSSPTITVTFSFRYTGLVRFDVSAIPVGSVITSATLELTNLQANADTAVDGYELLEDWDEGTVDGTPGVCNWTIREAPSTPWSGTGATGASRSTTPLFSLPPPSGAGRIMVAIPASTVMSWVTVPATNHGIELYGSAGTIAVSYASHENATAADRPALVLTYR